MGDVLLLIIVFVFLGFGFFIVNHIGSFLEENQKNMKNEPIEPACVMPKKCGNSEKNIKAHGLYCAAAVMKICRIKRADWIYFDIYVKMSNGEQYHQEDYKHCGNNKELSIER